MLRKPNRSAVLIGVVMAMTTAVSPAASTTPLVTSPTTFTAIADAWVDEAAPAVNSGLQSVLRIDAGPKVKRAYLRFDVTGVTFPVERVTLQVLAKSSSTAGHAVSQVTDNGWEENRITYGNAPPLGAEVARAGPVTAGQWSSVDVTALMQTNGPLSLALTTTSSAVVRYASREVNGKAPRLVVEGQPSGTTTTSSTSTSTTTTPTDPPPPPPGGDPILAAAGDIACDPADGNFNGGLGTAVNCRQMAVSDLILNMNPTVVAPLGDLQYDSGQLSQFNGSFDKSWGRFKAKIKPAVGNHEYKTDPKAAGYYTYFGAAAGDPAKGYYSYDLGAWHVVVLNSNCGAVGGCEAGSAQERWLRADLAAHPTPCTVAYWHHPRWSSGNHGSSPATDAFWNALYDARADLVLNSHDHIYERFAPQTPAGVADPERGIREFVVGTGGRSHYAVAAPAPNSEVRNTNTFGVLALTLHPAGYDWRFVSEGGGASVDAGSRQCH